MTFCRLLLVVLSLAMHAAAQGRTEALSVDDPERGGDQTRIVLVASPGSEPVAERFAAELESLNFQVIRDREVPGNPDAGELERLAERSSARAVVRVAVTPGAIDLWLVNATNHELIYRRIAAERDPAVAVLRSLEILRGSLIDVGAMKAPDPAPAVPAVEESAGVGEKRHLGSASAQPLWCGLSAAGIGARGGRDLSIGALAACHYSVSPELSVHAEGLVPLSEWHVESAVGRVHAWASSLAVAATFAPWPGRTVSPSVGAGVAALALHTRGEAGPGFRGSSDLNLSAYPHGRIDLTVGIGAALRARAELMAGFVAPRPVLLLAEERDDSWLNPVVMGAVGLELPLR